MKPHSTFIFDSYSFSPETGKIELIYSLDDEVTFTETLTIPTPYALRPTPFIDAALAALHLAGGASYYKTCCPKKIEVRSTTLNEKQATFWNTVYENGLGEFFYQNDIDFRGLINFPTESDEQQSVQSTGNKQGRILIPVGGGKDSIVTIERLRKSGADITLLRMGSHPLIDALVAKVDLPCITIERELDPQLFALNKEGALNGHIPITAYLSALSVVIAELYGFDEIAMSNEKSANEGNVEFHGKMINHQWSKSGEFESLLRSYVTTFINPELKYWSALREMTELEIAEEFAKYPEYYALCTSCNKNWKIAGDKQKERWCQSCPKCAFVFALLAAYLPKETLIEIFGANLYENASLIPLYKQLLGLEGFKPFECVGTPEETKEAFALAHKRGDLDETEVMKMFTDSQS